MRERKKERKRLEGSTDRWWDIDGRRKALVGYPETVTHRPTVFIPCD
jgi:hypothetical protein